MNIEQDKEILESTHQGKRKQAKQKASDVASITTLLMIAIGCLVYLFASLLIEYPTVVLRVFACFGGCAVVWTSIYFVALRRSNE